MNINIQEKIILKKLIEFEELFLLDEMLKEYSEIHLENLGGTIYIYMLLILLHWIIAFKSHVSLKYRRSMN